MINRRNCGTLIPTTLALEDIGLKNPKVYYVMRNRGNNDVAPTKEALVSFKATQDWEGYVNWYQGEKLRTQETKKWMQKIAEESLFRDVVLVCYEKNYLRCHRHLLATQIVQDHPEVCYVGEIRYSP